MAVQGNMTPTQPTQPTQPANTGDHPVNPDSFVEGAEVVGPIRELLNVFRPIGKMSRVPDLTEREQEIYGKSLRRMEEKSNTNELVRERTKRINHAVLAVQEVYEGSASQLILYTIPGIVEIVDEMKKQKRSLEDVLRAVSPIIRTWFAIDPLRHLPDAEACTPSDIRPFPNDSEDWLDLGIEALHSGLFPSGILILLATENLGDESALVAIKKALSDQLRRELPSNDVGGGGEYEAMLRLLERANSLVENGGELVIPGRISYGRPDEVSTGGVRIGIGKGGSITTAEKPEKPIGEWHITPYTIAHDAMRPFQP